MSRETKFRAWDKKRELFVPISKLCTTIDNATISNITQTWSGKSLLSHEYILEQFTGLTDKNGKDVFDGDLKSWKFNNHDWIYLCYWSEMDCGFRWKLVKHNEKQDVNNKNQIHYDNEKDYYDYVIKSNQRQHGMDQWSELIGNIHEKPELLK